MRVCVATAGHLSTCPRMLKLADALHAAGHDVHAVSARFVDWATDADRVLRASRPWSWDVVDITPAGGPWRRRWSGARHRLARTAAEPLNDGACPAWLVERAFSRVGVELTRAIVESRAGAVVAGTSGALGAARLAAARLSARLAIDLEDLHTAEREDSGARLHHGLARLVLAAVLPQAHLVSTASARLAGAYRLAFGIDPVVMHNVWPLPASPPAIDVAGGPVRFYWFSQTIGPGRGLEEAIRAIGLAGVPARLCLRGHVDREYSETLRGWAHAHAPALALAIEPPVPPDAVAATCAPFDIGLATELPVVENRRLTLSNKLFMYMTTGLAIMATTMPSQVDVLGPLRDHVAWMDPSDPGSVVPTLRRWSADPASLHAARSAACEAARQRWHWEHPLERDHWLQEFARTCA